MSIFKRNESREPTGEKSPEEIEAEECRAELSRQQKKMIEGLTAMGKKGYIKTNGFSIEGEINGHKLKIFPPKGGICEGGKVDDKSISSEEAMSLWGKYSPIAMGSLLMARVGDLDRKERTKDRDKERALEDLL